jgi:hypothetical protein
MHIKYYIRKLIEKLLLIFNYRLIDNKTHKKIKKLGKLHKLNFFLDELLPDIINKKSPIIFDVGLSVGNKSLNYKQMFQSSIIHAFEPNPNSLEIARRKLKPYNNIIFNNVGIGSKKGKKPF